MKKRYFFIVIQNLDKKKVKSKHFAKQVKKTRKTNQSNNKLNLNPTLTVFNLRKQTGCNFFPEQAQVNSREENLVSTGTDS